MVIYKKIIAVVVTHNRCKLLKRCINNILNQSLPPDEILVINNGSTDNTKDELDKLKINTINQDNLGSAGGWVTGIKYAIEKKFDAIWLMDDDGYPDRYSLEILKKSIDKEMSCLSSIVVKENNPEEFVFPYPILNENNQPTLLKWPRKLKNKKQLLKKIIEDKYPYAHLFNGALIPLNVIKKIGNVDENYFIYGDELDYTFRLMRQGQVFSNIKSIHYHPDVTKRLYSHTKIYYILKNTLIITKKYYDKVILRQIFQISNILLIILRRNGIKYFLKLTLIQNYKLIPLAIYRGLKGQIGFDKDV